MKGIQINRQYDKVLKIASKGDVKGIRELLKAYPNILNKPSEGHNRTLIWEAVNKNRIELINFLIEQSADVNIPGRYRSQNYVLLKPYCLAVQNKKEKLQNLLLSNGHKMDIFTSSFCGNEKEILEQISIDKTKVNQRQEQDKIWETTPLHYAVSGNNIPTIKALLNTGAVVKKHSKLLYDIACRNNRLDIVKLLSSHGGAPKEVDVFPVFYHNNEELIQYFVDKGLNCDKLLQMDWPPIVYLCRGDKGEHPEKIKNLLKHVKKINAQTPNGVSALHAAAKAGFLSIVKILLENGSTINIRDKKGKTPLTYSRKHKRKEVEDFLEKNGAIE